MKLIYEITNRSRSYDIFPLIQVQFLQQYFASGTWNFKFITVILLFQNYSTTSLFICFCGLPLLITPPCQKILMNLLYYVETIFSKSKGELILLRIIVSLFIIFNYQNVSKTRYHTRASAFRGLMSFYFLSGKKEFYSGAAQELYTHKHTLADI